MGMTLNADAGFKNSESLLYLLKEGVKDARPAVGGTLNRVKTGVVQ